MIRYELNKLTSLPMCGFIAQLVEHRTGIAEVTGSNPVEALLFFRLCLSSCLNWKIHCDDHSSLSVSKVVLEVCDAITKHLGPEYIHLPQTAEEMQRKVSQFELKFGMIQAFRCIDGTHVPIKFHYQM